MAPISTVASLIHVGDRHKHLTVVKTGGTLLCECECRRKIKVKASHFLAGKRSSCGCRKDGKPIKPGDRFNMLEVIEPAGSRKQTRYWLCKCDCGNTHETSTKGLRGGHTKSCGCLRGVKGGNPLHQTRAYTIWQGMRRRCYEKTNNHYPRYGARGVGVCDRWRYSFENFLADMGQPPSDLHSIDRIAGGLSSYTPENCRWADWETQNNNRGDYNTRLTYQGVTQTVAEWSREIGIAQTTLCMRMYKYGWSVEKTLSTPVRRKG